MQHVHHTVQAKGDSDLKADDDDEDVQAAAAAAAGAGAGAAGALADRKIPPIVSHWNLAEYLPASVRQVFLILVSTFLLKPHEKARQLRLDHERYGDGGQVRAECGNEISVMRSTWVCESCFVSLRRGERLNPFFFLHFVF